MSHSRTAIASGASVSPSGPERSSAELDECFRHECLLNLAFADADGFRLLCPYDTAALARDVIDRAFISHPVMLRDGVERSSRRYRPPESLDELLQEPLPPPSQPGAGAGVRAR